jgi:YggT family protein
MKAIAATTLFALVAALLAECASASVFMPYTSSSTTSRSRFAASSALRTGTASTTFRQLRLALHRQKQRRHDITSSSSLTTAMAIPGYGVAEQVFVGGFGNFLGIYNLIITARILLSWFPQAQSIGVLQPVYAITDPYLNLFRGLIPPLFGLDFSPLLAFFLLSVLQNATVAVGAELTPEMKQKLHVFRAPTTGPTLGGSSRTSTGAHYKIALRN